MRNASARGKGPLMLVLLGCGATALAIISVMLEEAGDPAPASPGDCVQAGLAVRAWHSEIVLPASAFEPGSAVHTLFPEAEAYAVSWGDADAFVDGVTPGRAVPALAWPTLSVVHVVAHDAMPGREGDVLPIALSGAGIDTLAASIEAAIARDSAGHPIIAAPGQYAGRSVFVRGSERYHGLRTCNVWTAQQLDAAGLGVFWPRLHALPWTLSAELSRRAPATCQAE